MKKLIVPVFCLLCVAGTSSPSIAGDKNPTVQTLARKVSRKKLKTYLSKLVSFRTRYTFSSWKAEDREIGAACRWIRKKFNRFSNIAAVECLVSYQVFDVRRWGQSAQARNVMLVQRGTRYPKKAIVLGAHYDSINIDAIRKRNSKLPAPGANDDGSGTALILEMARILTKKKHPYTIIYTAYAGEEVGLFGSRAHAELLSEVGVEVVCMFNNDTVGTSAGKGGEKAKSRCRVYSKKPRSSRSRMFARYAKFVGERYLNGFSLDLRNRQDRPGRGGDHQSFYKEGFPAIRFIEGLENTNYQHNEKDTLERIDFNYLHKMTKLNIAVTATLATAPGQTRITKANVNGNTVRANWKPVRGAAGYVVALRKKNKDGFSRTISTQKPTAKFQVQNEGEYHISVSVEQEKNLFGPFCPEHSLKIK